MQVVAGLIGMIGAISGFVAALFTLYAGWILGLFWIKKTDIIILAAGSIFFSFICIILSAIFLFAKDAMLVGILLLVSAIFAAIMGGMLVTMCMTLCITAIFLPMFDHG